MKRSGIEMGMTSDRQEYGDDENEVGRYFQTVKWEEFAGEK